ncbi:MAG: S41 family peptidase [Clostridiales bacterium]|nr:S41 family peptidase [Eubacteriales bacterium]MDH7565792.1 S41 family peptidase [Clostridiales bacterium]
MEKNFLGKILMLFLVISLLAVQPIAAYGAEEIEKDDSLRYIKSTMEMLKDIYRGEVSDRDLTEGALKGIFESMDPYTSYLTKEEAKEYLTTISGVIEGIGISTCISGNYVVVSKVFPDSPAEEAGMIPGDKIVSVDGKNVIGASIEEVSKYINGEFNVNLTIGLIRNGDTEIKLLSLLRRHVVINPVSYDIRGQIGYIKIDFFNSNTSTFLIQALNELDAKKINKIILDLRNNPGGEVEQAVEVARKFVPEGLIVKLVYKSKKFVNREYYSYLKSPKYKLAVLVNEMSASSSEILAGAIQDTKAGVLIGSKTYGKARVQTIIPLLSPQAYLKYENMLGTSLVNSYDLIKKYNIVPTQDEILGYANITTGYYYTPDGKMIDETGLTPDIQVEDSPIVDDLDLNEIQKLRMKSKLTLDGRSLDVYNAEKILKICGYDVNNPDMVLDAKTFKAIEEFQRDRGLYPYGVLDYATQNELNNRLGELILKIDRQYAKAVEYLNAQEKN